MSSLGNGSYAFPKNIRVALRRWIHGKGLSNMRSLHLIMQRLKAERVVKQHMKAHTTHFSGSSREKILDTIFLFN
jgi:hypothetical protein